MFSFHINVPQGAKQLDIKLDFLATAAPSGFSAGASTSANLALLSWNEVVVYPAKTNAADLMITPSIKLPEQWKFGTALEVASGNGSGLTGLDRVSVPVRPSRLSRSSSLSTRPFLPAAGFARFPWQPRSHRSTSSILRAMDPKTLH